MSTRRDPVVGLVAIAGAAGLGVSAWLAVTGRLSTVDADVARWSTERVARAGDVVASLVALPASGAISVLWGAVLVAAAVRGGRLRVAVAVGASLVAVVGVELVLKGVLHHPGPPPTGRTVTFGIGGGPQTGNSFPSGHMARSMVLGTGTVLICGPPRARRALAVAAMTWIALVMLTRVYLAEHWASDVIGGLCLGATVVPLLISADRGWRTA